MKTNEKTARRTNRSLLCGGRWPFWDANANFGNFAIALNNINLHVNKLRQGKHRENKKRREITRADSGALN
jgi:hypothetical protein